MSVGATSGRVDWSAGARPKRMPVRVETVSAKARMRRSGDVDTGCGLSGLTKKRSTSGAPTAASMRPARVPTSESIRLSARSCCTSRRRVAPRASRTAISRPRAAPRARRRLATFAHAMRSTPAAVPMSSHSGAVSARRNEERPCAAGSSTSAFCT